MGGPGPDPEPVGTERQAPLIVDLDGTLVRSDLLIESLLLLAKRAPLRLLSAAAWLVKGRAYFKRRIAREIVPDVATLPYDRDLISYLETEKKSGRQIILATGTDSIVATDVANHVGLFDRVLASDGSTNLSGDEKRDKLAEEFGTHGFDYIGNGHNDRVVRAAARKAMLTQSFADEPEHPEQKAKIDRPFNHAPAGMKTYLKALRPHQWLKNLLVFFPLALNYPLDEPALVLKSALAFVAFTLCASSGYVFNDLMDLPDDRHHPRKKERPLASGQFPLTTAAGLMFTLLIGGVAVGLLLPASFVGVLAGYYAISLAYSLRLKEILILDVLTLAVLYTLRVIGGALALSMPIPSWLLAFCVFLFFSLALVKRYAELVTMRGIDGNRAHARAYLFQDRELIAALGGASGYLAALVLGLYIESRTPNPQQFSHYQLLWFDCLLLLYWISYLWLKAHRGLVAEDPLVFALRDRVSITLVLSMVAVFIGVGLS